MGILSDIGNWVSTHLPTVVSGVKKAAELVHKTASIVESLLEGKAILAEADTPPESMRGRKTSQRPPDIMGQREHQSNSSEISIMRVNIDESKKKLVTIEESNELEHRRIQLQIDVMELVVSASTFERFSNNINLHAANLNIHLQTIQNTAGLMDGMNRQRVAIKALMGTVNHLRNVLGVTDKVDKLEGLDIDIRPDSISIHGAYKAFENTRDLLLGEIDSFSDAIAEQLERVEHVRVAARGVPNISKKMSDWLETSVEPKLIDARKYARELKGDLEVIPRLETKLRRELEVIKQDKL